MQFFRWLGLWISLVLIAGCATSTTTDVNQVALTLTAPGERLVYQRGLDGTARLPISGTCSWPAAQVQVRLLDAASGREVQQWKGIGLVRANGRFDARHSIKAGWYRLEVRATKGRRQATATLERVGVGEVFIVVGHSVAQGGRTNLAGATDDRVSTIAWPANAGASRKQYERTGDAMFLPAPAGVPFADAVAPAPFGHGTYFWAQFAERLTRTEKVPVLLLNAAFGGTSLEHWAKSARAEMFEHSFVKSEIRMPYLNLHHALKRYAAVTGVRAILADQGQNDWSEKDERKVFANYHAWVQQARVDLEFPNLAIVVNRASPPGGNIIIRQVQERMIREIPHCFAGPDYDSLAKSDRYDGVHLSASGMERAARLWAEALTPSFFLQAEPSKPKP